MSYLNLSLESLCWELKSLMDNNYHGETTKENFEEKFILAKEDILETVKDIINQNKEEVLNYFDFEE